MTDNRILSDEQIKEECALSADIESPEWALQMGRAIEQAVLQSPQVQQWRKDAERYQWLRSPESDVALVLDKCTGYVAEDEQVPGVGGYHTYEYRSGLELDEKIDAAMEKTT